MTVTVPTVDLVRSPVGRGTNGVWHIERDAQTTRCAWATTPDMVRELDVDAHVIAFKGKPVCIRCRRAT